jgi:hypothetical protein
MIALRLPAELIEAVDKHRGDQDRTAYLEDALRAKLGKHTPPKPQPKP